MIFALFMLIHTLTTAFTTLYGDDYYYAAFVKNGADYFLSENIFHYLHTNGRAFVHLLDELLIGYSFFFWQIFNVLCLATLVIGIAKIAAKTYKADSDKNTYRYALVITCLILCLTDVAILREGFYWATGMMNYLFPATVTIWFYYLFRRDFESFKDSPTLIFTAFVASITTEQASAAALLVTLCFIVSSIVIKKKCPKPAYFGAFAASLIGFCTIFLSPGTAERTQYYPEFYEMSLIERIASNIGGMISVTFSNGGLCAILLIFYIITAIVCFKYYNEGKNPTLSLIIGLESTAAAFLYTYSITKVSLLSYLWVIPILLFPILAAMIYTAVRYFTKGEVDELYFIWCAVAMQLAMLASPQYGARTLIISLTTLIIPIVTRIIENDSTSLRLVLGALSIMTIPWYMNTPAKMLAIFAAVLILSIIICQISEQPNIKKIAGCVWLSAAIAQFSTVAFGYYGNISTNEKNKTNIENYLKESEPPSSLILYYLPNDMYRYTMPYDDKYHAGKLMELCGIDPNITIWYEVIS